jgi:hypothetical protein
MITIIFEKSRKYRLFLSRLRFFTNTPAKKSNMIEPMMTKFPTVLLLVLLAALSAPAANDPASAQLQIYPKNLARHHLGTSLLIYDDSSKSYVANEAAAAWLDDDVSTGWPPRVGQQFYLLAFARPELITTFCISARAPAGTVSLYAGDQLAPPSSKSWTPLAKDVPLDTINDKKPGKPFSRYTKYLLIETNITDSGPWYSLYTYGDKPAVSYRIQKRAQRVDARALLGPYANPEQDFNLSSLYGSGRVVYSNGNSSGSEGFVSSQKSIDDNPESSVILAPSTGESGLVIKYSESRAIQRVAVLADPAAKGKLDFFFLKDLPGEAAAAKPVPLADLTPTVSLVFDGTNSRGAINFPATPATGLVARWTPDTAGQNLAIREINTFGDITPDQYEIGLGPEAIAELAVDRSKDMSKEMASDFKEPIGEYLPNKAPFLPGPLNFPPRVPVNLPPTTPTTPP